MPPRITDYGARRIRRSNAKIEDEQPLAPMRLQHTELDEEYTVGSPTPRVFSRVLYGARFPTPASTNIMKFGKGGKRTSSSIKTASLVNFNGKEALQLRDPYTSPHTKARFEDCYRLDPIVRRSLNLIAKFTLGKRMSVVVDTAEEFLDARLTSGAKGIASNNSGSAKMPPIPMAPPVSATTNRAAAHNSIISEEEDHGFLSDQEIMQLKSTMEHVNRRVKFHEKLKSAVIQAKVGGRAALLIEGKDDDGLPLDLKVLNWRKLGTVYADPDTWQLRAVEYADRNRDDPLLPEEMIYLTNQDFHVSPDTLYYGLSEVETIGHISEANRLIDEEDLKEGNRSSWAHHGLIKFPPNVTEEEIDEFLENFYPGTWNGTSQDVMVETHNLNIAVNEIVHERNENDKRILRGLGVPAFLIGFEDVTNRATTVAVLHAWRESELNDYRTWLQNSLEPQWLDPLARIILPDKNWDNMRMKARFEFQDITFESLKEKVDAVIPLFTAGLISTHKALRMLDMEDELEHLISVEDEIKEMRKQELLIRERALMRSIPKQQQGGGGFGSSNSNSRTSTPAKPGGTPHDTGTPVNNVAAASSKKEKVKDHRNKK